ncbi:MAG: glycine--tRNA ligase subunit beta [Devosiaceae bacterium]|nr:glycine--tRNA ligase subunit beta [Devosiaceae bacterium]
MSEFLLELFSEEIPARFQRKAANDLKKLVTNALVDAGLTYESAKSFVTPRRLALVITGLPKSSPDTRSEKKGPKIDAPEQAIAGFLRGAGLNSINEATIQSDPKKGEFYVAVIEKKGLSTVKILSEIMPKIIKNFPWAKSMRWGNGKLNWVRPLRSIVAIFSNEIDESEIVGFEIDDIKSGDETYGHRFLSPKPIKIKRFDDYAQSLQKAHVVLDIDRRMQIIEQDANQLSFAKGLKLISDKRLLEEVAGLVEWPVPMMGSFEKDFLSLPKEVIVTTIKANQKCFCLTDEEGKLTNKFILVSNMIADDGGKLIIAGNESVITARLKDALFFYENDLKAPLADRLPKLKSMIFHAKLGSQFERVERIISLAKNIAPQIGADIDLTARAANLAKADLVSEMVNEFASLQGLMGRYYALEQGEDERVANAIQNHYKPVGASDEVPTEPISIAVALADKLDLLNSFWSINEKPTGSRDPFALRRAALGIIRILVENKIDFQLDVEPDLLSFFHDRLKVMLRDNGARHDLVDAVITALSNDMFEITLRVNALSDLLEKPAGIDLLAGYRRAVNILLAEEKKEGSNFSGEVDLSLLSLEQEIALKNAIDDVAEKVQAHIKSDDFSAAIQSLASLQKPVDNFFEHVLVNDEDKSIRKNRLNLLAYLRDVMHLVANFSKIEG